MAKSKIFLVGHGAGSLTTLEESSYDAEHILQRYLADHPDLLPGDQINPDTPRRWLLVAREMGIPGDTDESGRWSLDHLFLDQDGIPTFVECKRASDTRARREVVAQMLDYAANGVEYWKVEQIQAAAAETAQKHKRNIDDELRRLLQTEDPTEIEVFWGQVADNLHNRRIRLIFVSDAIPRELRRLVEFLNEELTHVEVLAVEVKQFQREGEAVKALVPRVLGLTETARATKRTGRPFTTQEEFMAKCQPEAREFYQRVLDQAGARGHVVYWGTLGFSIRARTSRSPSGLVSFLYGYPPATFEFFFDKGLGLTGDQAQALRKQLLDFGVFKESGGQTLRTILSKEVLARIDPVVEFVFDQVEKIVGTNDPPSSH